MLNLFFKGSVEVPLDSIPANSEVEKWLPLRLPGTSPRPSPKNASNKNDQLSIRVKVKYQVIKGKCNSYDYDIKSPDFHGARLSYNGLHHAYHQSLHSLLVSTGCNPPN